MNKKHLQKVNSFLGKIFSFLFYLGIMLFSSLGFIISDVLLIYILTENCIEIPFFLKISMRVFFYWLYLIIILGVIGSCFSSILKNKKNFAKKK